MDVFAFRCARHCSRHRWLAGCARYCFRRALFDLSGPEWIFCVLVRQALFPAQMVRRMRQALFPARTFEQALRRSRCTGRHCFRRRNAQDAPGTVSGTCAGNSCFHSCSKTLFPARVPETVPGYVFAPKHCFRHGSRSVPETVVFIAAAKHCFRHGSRSVPETVVFISACRKQLFSIKKIVSGTNLCLLARQALFPARNVETPFS